MPAEQYLPTQPGELFILQERVRVLYRLLRAEALLPLHDKRVVEVGFGTGTWLAEFEAAGVRRENLAGMELSPERAAVARARFAALRDETGKLIEPGPDLRIGDASDLPWPDNSFDLVLQSTVFTSILDFGMRQAIAAEMMRVTRPDGAILWYDFFVDNPRNAAVRGVRANEIRALFPRWRVRLQRITLAPPLVRRIAPKSWALAYVLGLTRLLNTHYLGVIRRH